MNGCWSHFTKRIWAKVQEFGITPGFHENIEITRFIKQLMAIPFLPASLISPTFTLLQKPNLTTIESIKLDY